MTDLRVTIGDAAKAAHYFQVDIELVQEAMDKGCQTYQDLHDFLMDLRPDEDTD